MLKTISAVWFLWSYYRCSVTTSKVPSSLHILLFHFFFHILSSSRPDVSFPQPAFSLELHIGHVHSDSIQLWINDNAKYNKVFSRNVSEKKNPNEHAWAMLGIKILSLEVKLVFDLWKLLQLEWWDRRRVKNRTEISSVYWRKKKVLQQLHQNCW